MIIFDLLVLDSMRAFNIWTKLFDVAMPLNIPMVPVSLGKQRGKKGKGRWKNG